MPNQQLLNVWGKIILYQCILSFSYLLLQLFKILKKKSLKIKHIVHNQTHSYLILFVRLSNSEIYEKQP